ncbi:uncharacterized protein LOC116174460 isoform X2 [Photinus pyralis]|uniref:uncharacterized protein LOC116158986 n=1 Tax=Photinus pyralis TaxID=7054 RepID=UPI0012672A0B|nr:uncharacterized protein LOC116158986 [Photinus pyralis]XP_031348246.1 uncharacterized protein LOC116174460 isoform X2 [Photinus pyralis]
MLETILRGQEFYHKHVLAMFVAKLFGLLTVISTPTILKILTFTNMSSTPLTAYKRYLATVYHMCVWYDNDFKPGSKLWDSINKVKMMHCSASRRHCVAGGQRILQRDMGITQFGFMGFAILTPEKVGIHNATREELESFIHLWRVIGYIMGADDKYNICKGTLEETREICEGLVNNIFIDNVKTKNANYQRLADALVNGMWAMQPFLEPTAFKTYLANLLSSVSNNNLEIPTVPLNLFQYFIFYGLQAYIFSLQFHYMRIFANFLQYLSFWLMHHFPFLAFYSYGYKNSFVAIFKERLGKRG